MGEYERRKRGSLITGIILFLLFTVLIAGVVYREFVLDVYFKMSTPRYVYTESSCGEGKLYVDEDLGISFEYPEGWSVRIKEQDSIVLLGGDGDNDVQFIEIAGSDTVIIAVSKSKEHPREYLWSVEEINLPEGFKIDRRWRVDIGGRDGWGWQRFEWIGMDGSASDGAYVIEAVAKNEGTMYHLIYSKIDVTQFDEGLCYFEMVMDSLRFYSS